MHSGIGRIGAILGNVMFGHLLDVNRAIPIITVASLLLVGALSAVFLPSVYRPENRPPLVKLLQTMKNKCKATCKRKPNYYRETDKHDETGTLCTSM